MKGVLGNRNLMLLNFSASLDSEMVTYRVSGLSIIQIAGSTKTVREGRGH